MPVIEAKTGKVVKDFTIDELREKANEMRAWNLLSLCAAKSGHAGGTLSIMDIVAALYLKEMNHDPKNPDWDDRDRTIWSVGHKAPALYIGLAFAGYFDKKECLKLRKLWSGLEGHPNRLKVKGVEVSSGSSGTFPCHPAISSINDTPLPLIVLPITTIGFPLIFFACSNAFTISFISCPSHLITCQPKDSYFSAIGSIFIMSLVNPSI